MADKNPSNRPDKPADGPQNNESLEPIKDGSERSVDPFGIDSVDPDGVIDHTGTIGATEMSSILANGNGNGNGNGGDVDYVATHQIDDDYLDKIHSILPSDLADQKSDSKGGSKGSRVSYSESMTVQGFRIPDGPEEMIPPLRDIQFPSDTAAIEKGQTQDPSGEDTDEYRILGKLGSGGYGIVYEAQQSALSRSVAVKVLKPRKRKGSRTGGSRTGTGTGETKKRQGRFLHEAKVTAKLQHPNIIPLYDFGVNPRGELFYSMKKVQKRPWTSIIRKPLQLLQISAAEITEKIYRDAIKKNVEIFSAVCDGMAYAHSEDIIHRDLKPENVMIGNYNEVLIIDFGMALDLKEKDQEFTAGGTLVYMAPEMARHYDKQRAIQYVIRQTARQLGEETGSIFIDQAYVHGVRRLAEGLIKESEDPSIIKLAEDLIKLDEEEKELGKQITVASDIYLLGAILYEVAVGHPPHYYPMKLCNRESEKSGQNSRQIKQNYELRLALNNDIQQYEKPKDALCVSLRDIALKAMSTDPKDRFRTVKELQDAIQGFQRQVQSHELTETGKELVAKASGRQDYQHLLPALESFRGAKDLWPDEEANKMQVETACSYGTRAFVRRDFDAGLDILDEYVEPESKSDRQVVEVRKKLEKGKRDRKRNRLLGIGTTAAALLLSIGLFGYFNIRAWQYRNEIADVKSKKEQVEQELAVVEPQLAAADKRIASAVKREQDANERADKAVEEADKRVKAEVAQARKDADKDIQIEKDKAAREVAAARTQANKDIEEANKRAEREKEKAAADIKIAQQRAAQVKFDADLGAFSANVLPVQSFFRRNQIDQAKAKLEEFAQSDSKPNLKNGWLVKHYGRKANVQFKSAADIDGAEIVSILGSGEKQIIVANRGGKPFVGSLNADGELNQVDLPLPESSTVVSAAMDNSGQYLAVALEYQGEILAEPISVFDINTGFVKVPVEAQLAKRRFPENAGDDNDDVDDQQALEIIGCRGVDFGGSAGRTLRLTSVEELSGKFGLKRRLQIVTRVLGDKEFRLDAAEPVAVGATMRDENPLSPKYLADIRSDSDRTKVLIAYPTLDREGGDALRLESFDLNENGESRESSSSLLASLPTALHVSTEDKVFLGYANGGIEQYSFLDLEAKPTTVGDTNDSRITLLATTPDGRLVSTGEDGKIVVWNEMGAATNNFVLTGQSNPISSVGIFSNATDGLEVVTGDRAGGIRVWTPDNNRQRADARLDRNGSILVAAIDQGVDAGAEPAVAIGNNDGDVLFYGRGDLLDAASRYSISQNGPEGQSSYKFKILSPFKSIDLTFDDFDAMGIIQDDFFVLNDDGTFTHSQIDDSAPEKPATESSRSHKIIESSDVSPDFVPFVASVDQLDYFFTTHPEDPSKLLAWTKQGEKYSTKDIQLEGGGSTADRSFVRRLAISPDGRWLAAVRKIRFDFSIQIYRINDSQEIDGLDLELVDTTDKYSVGEPAFIAFSPNSDEFVYHFHRLGVERETWIERLSLNQGSWGSGGEPQRIGLTKHGVVSWIKDADQEKFIAKLNKQFYVTVPDQSDGKWDWISARGMRPAIGGRGYYVLDENGIRIEDFELKLDDPKAVDSGKRKYKNAKAMRIFGDRIVVFDDEGFHLVKQDLTYETVLAKRKNPVGKLSLSNGKLAVVHKEQSSCRIFDVGNDQPKSLGKIDGIQNVEISRNGEFAAGIKDRVLFVYKITDVFDKELFRRDVASNTQFRWVGSRETSRLLLAEQDANQDADSNQVFPTRWTGIEVDGNREVAIEQLAPVNLPRLEGFGLSPLTSKYLVTQSAAGLSLWMVQPELAEDGKALLLDRDVANFDVASIPDVRSFAFSEISSANAKDIATRLVVLSSPENAEAAAQELNYLLIADEVAEDENQSQARFRVEKIDGALEVEEGRSLISAEFSGDGRSLLQVDGKGITVLLSE